MIPIEIMKRLTTRNIIALSMTATVLTVILQMTFNAKELIVTIAENQEWVVTGAIIFGFLIAKYSDIIQFYFRKSQSKEKT